MALWGCDFPLLTSYLVLGRGSKLGARLPNALGRPTIRAPPPVPLLFRNSPTLADGLQEGRETGGRSLTGPCHFPPLDPFSTLLHLAAKARRYGTWMKGPCLSFIDRRPFRCLPCLFTKLRNHRVGKGPCTFLHRCPTSWENRDFRYLHPPPPLAQASAARMHQDASSSEEPQVTMEAPLTHPPSNLLGCSLPLLMLSPSLPMIHCHSATSRHW